MIKLSNVNKYYHKGKTNEIHVINDASLEITGKGLVAFLGASGSGKTTLLNVIGGLDRASGKFIYDDLELNNYKAHRIDEYREKNVGYVFQKYNLLPQLTVYENLKIALDIIGIKETTETKERIYKALKSVGMFKYRKRLAGALSGGQQQRVSIARALVKNAKIVIADEPTGNLDSQNSIEVMNILKRISKKCIVLLVTHDVKIAHFYADRIVEIKDGSIINDYMNDNRDKNYGTEKSDRQIFLQDLEIKEENFEEIHITKYSDEKMPKIDIKLVYVNGSFFLETSSSVQIINDSSRVKLIDDHYQEIKTDDLKADFEYDFADIEQTKKVDFKGFFAKIGLAIKKFFLVRGRTKLLYFAFAVVGALLALCFYEVGSYSYVNDEGLLYDKNAYIIENDKDTSSLDVLNMILDNNSKVSRIEVVETYFVNFYNKENASENENGVETFALYRNCEGLSEDDLIYGRLPQNSQEIVVDKTIINEWVKKSNRNWDIRLDVEDFIGKQAQFIFDNLVTIVGISDSDATCVYYEKPNFIFYNHLFDNVAFNISSSEYEIVFGREPVLGENEIIVSLDSYLNSKFFMDDTFSYDKIVGDTTETVECKVVGVFVSDSCSAAVIYEEEDYRNLLNEYVLGNKNYFAFNNSFISNTNNTILTDGCCPQSKGEIVLSSQLPVEIGDVIKLGEDFANFVVVGLYDSSQMNNSMSIGFTAFDYISMRWVNSESVYIYTDDFEDTKTFFNEKGYTLRNVYDYALSLCEDDDNIMNVGKYFFIILLLIESILFTYFIMRARMISRIYDIGVYRALGARKWRIIRDFLLEIIVLTTLTTIVGYIVMACLIFKTTDAFNTIGNIFNANWRYVWFGGLSTYLINVLFGLLPVILLLRKTPSEIVAKYDI